MGDLLSELRALAETVGGRPPVTLAERSDGVVLRSGAVVVKAHAADTDRPALAARLALAARPELRPVLLAPLPLRVRPGHAAHPLPPNPSPSPEHPSSPEQLRTVAAASSPGSAEAPCRAYTAGRPWCELAGRPVTVWPHGNPVDRDDPDAAPWEEAAALLAALHRLGTASLPGTLPPMRGPAKVARALGRLRDSLGHRHRAACSLVLAAAGSLPPWASGSAPQPASATLVHGDLHLGQLVRCPETGEWRLIDVDDLGLGDPAWDLARPAAWYATGLLPPHVWQRFLAAYRAAEGPALRSGGDGDPWAALDVPARALTVQSAALAVLRAQREDRPLDEVDTALVDACGRISDIARTGVVS